VRDVTATFSTRSALREIAEESRAVRAELIVTGRADHPDVARVIETARCPVLVSRPGAIRRYRRPLVALDLDRSGLEVLAFALRMLASPRPPLAVVHAYAAPFAGVAARSPPGTAVAAYQDLGRIQALWQLAWWLARARAELGVGEHGLAGRVEVGDPCGVIPRVASDHGSDLLVIGSLPPGGVLGALVGHAATELARSVECDVLFVPPRTGA
jgi:nucleotide-binding universal stress UspA family protein